MIGCKGCGAKYPTERLFCGKCKKRLGLRCACCGFINLLDDHFCGICLSGLSAKTEVPVEQETELPLSSGISFFDEIQMGAQEDQAVVSTDEKLEQDDIDNLFQIDGES